MIEANEPLPLSVSLIASNEEQNLARCLRSVEDLAEEIVLVYNDCSDRTVAIAEKFGARCFEEVWQGHRDQKNLALDKATKPWILCVDADEEVSEPLKLALRRFVEDGDCEGFDGAFFPRKSFFLGRWILHGDWYPDHSLRLIRRGKGRWAGSREHDKMKTEGKVRKLHGDLLHYSFPSISSYLEKTNYYADFFLQRQLDAKSKWRVGNVVFRPAWRFFRAYFLRLGFLDGFPGFFLAAATAFSTLVRHSRLYEHEVRERSGRDDQSKS